MSSIPIERIDDPAIGRMLGERIDAHNLAATGIHEWHPLTFVIRDGDGEVAAGVDGWEWGGTCFVKSLWVRESRRGAGLGTALMEAMEAEARRLGCSQMVLETHSFQAPAFYQRFGFASAGAVAGYPRGEAFLLMVKRLGD